MQPESSYVLAQHVFMTSVDERYVFLDLRSDRYLCLDHKHSENVRHLLRNPAAALSMPVWTPRGGDHAGDGIIAALVHRGLLVRCEDPSAVAPRLTLPPPKSALQNRVDTVVRPAHVRRFLRSAVRTSAQLRWKGIEETVDAVVSMRPANPEGVNVHDTELLAALTGIFRRLRHYYPRPYLCLFDSLALLYFLSSYSLFPRWVFAVRLQPFGAHCWIQADDRVVNDQLDDIRPYSPIMCI